MKRALHIIVHNKGLSKGRYRHEYFSYFAYMPANDIVLIIISGLGVVHGLFLALFLWTYSKGKRMSNRLLALLLVVFSFRIGKSVLLEFATALDIKLVFTGLGTLMAIGPLYYLYVLSCADPTFRPKKKQLIHFIPAMLGMSFGLWVREEHTETLPILIFFVLFVTYYSHYLLYLLVSHAYISRQRKAGLNKNIYDLLKLLFYGMLVIWFAYVLNLFDDTVPYVVGPILYSLVAYVTSFIIIQKGYIQSVGQTKYKTTSVPDEQQEQIYSKVLQLIENEEYYKNPDVSLRSLSERLHISTQSLSMIINQKSRKNFNGFINDYRIKEARRLLHDDRHKNHTVAAIAFEVGFNSISSFNTAFKKQTGVTPAVYRMKVMK
ncbi:AraC family transcriptional regulator [Fulvivirga sp. M361]|uniref:helix-turn-helix domain-containing protein n=1 Tax=Fulvivirga sp. M361 TaxID=2594266 RepID=UPI001179AF47|nr:helix-turn-helix domain-containing protein [Fulvivirga sp. M361]TRX47272.1 AraC family transcriptional regulator [Fulvivirga sp. M361]